MIVATAGHVDHGKTLLIRALTGIDTARLPEEKERGMTIDLGFAYLPVASSEPIGFIDVPGHERFIRNMLCGVAGIDAVLLVIAADDGAMPQTREHVAILDLLGVRRGVVALTKVDRVAPERVAEVAAEAKALLGSTTLSDASILPVSAASGEGVKELKDALTRMAATHRARAVNGNFRMAVDRSFTLAGAGLVVTGTAVSGEVAVGDQVRTLCADLSVRVRGIHAQNTPVPNGRAGQRCALNLAGAHLDREAVRRGDWIVGGTVPGPVAKVDARLRVLATETRPLQHWTPVHVHIGASEVSGRVAVLDGRAIEPGDTRLVQLLLDRPIGALHGDGIIVRDQSSQRTVGGGRVIDVFPPARGRAKPERLAYLAAMEIADHAAALHALLERAAGGLDLQRFAANRNLSPAEATRLLEQVPMKRVAMPPAQFGFSLPHWKHVRTHVLQVLNAWHQRLPGAAGLAEDRILDGAGLRLARESVIAIATALAEEGTLAKNGLGVRLPGYEPVFEGADAALWRKVAPVLDAGGLRPPVVREIAASIDEDAKHIEAMLVRAARLGRVVRLSPNRFAPMSAVRRLADIAAALASEDESGRLSVGTFRDRTGVGRNLAIELLEFFDRVKFTRRVGDTRKVLRPASEIFVDKGTPPNIHT